MLDVSRPMIVNYEKSQGVPAIDVLGQMAVELETRFKIKDLIITVERVSPRLRSVPKQLRLDFEKAQTFERKLPRQESMREQIAVADY